MSEEFLILEERVEILENRIGLLQNNPEVTILH